MTCDNHPNELRHLWQSQQQAGFLMSPEELRSKTRRLNREVLIRNGTVWFVCLFEIFWFVWILIALPELFIRIGSALVIAGMAYLTGQVWLDWRSRRASRQRAEQSGNINSLDFFRSELERQREFHRGFWFWSRIAALTPGLLVFGIGAVVLYPWPASLPGWAVTGVTVLIVPVAVGLNRKRSRDYQRQIDAVDALREPPG